MPDWGEILRVVGVPGFLCFLALIAFFKKYAIFQHHHEEVIAGYKAHIADLQEALQCRKALENKRFDELKHEFISRLKDERMEKIEWMKTATRGLSVAEKAAESTPPVKPSPPGG
jgi:hypothetical protein